MTWSEAIDRTVVRWRWIRDSIETASDLELLTEIHAICPMCLKAEELAGRAVDRCECCLAFNQFGGCYELDGQMSQRIAVGDREGLRQLVDRFLAELEGLAVPPEEIC